MRYINKQFEFKIKKSKVVFFFQHYLNLCSYSIETKMSKSFFCSWSFILSNVYRRALKDHF